MLIINADEVPTVKYLANELISRYQRYRDSAESEINKVYYDGVCDGVSLMIGWLTGTKNEEMLQQKINELKRIGLISKSNVSDRSVPSKGDNKLQMTGFNEYLTKFCKNYRTSIGGGVNC